MRSCQALLISADKVELISSECCVVEVNLALAEAGRVIVNEMLVGVRKNNPDEELDDIPSLDMETCGKSAVEFIERDGLRVWVCAQHFDEYTKIPSEDANIEEEEDTDEEEL
jgi:hypothetical protein